MVDVLESRFVGDRLMLIAADRISEWIVKGEVAVRYFNPGEVFREVHLLLLNDDRPDMEAVQKMVGEAKVFVYNYLPIPGLYEFSWKWRPWRVERWARGVAELVGKVRPKLIRCHGANINSFVAHSIKRALGIPYIVSMHINPELDLRMRPEWREGWRDRMRQRADVAIQRWLERKSLSDADCVVCVYRFIEDYARTFGGRRVEVIYNVTNPDNVRPKGDYALSHPARVIIPGRQFKEKDPSPVISAMAELPDVHCTFVGDGPYHEMLKSLAADLGVAERCYFLRSIRNDDLCRTLKDFDILVSVNDYGGVSKVELEAAQVGLPVITNRHPSEREPEVLGRNCVVVGGDSRSYREALRGLMLDEERRRSLGTNLRQSVAHLTGERMEHAYASLYREIMIRD